MRSATSPLLPLLRSRVQDDLLALLYLRNAWALRRWRGLLYRVRDIFRAAGALVCVGRWFHRIPTRRSSMDTLRSGSL
jgi:hypothetical protein